MTGAWASSNRRAELPADWSSRIVPEVRRRAGGRCQWADGCNQPGAEADHRGDRYDHSFANLQWLCKDHHRQKTLEEATAGRRRYKSPKRREPHPGEL